MKLFNWILSLTIATLLFSCTEKKNSLDTSVTINLPEIDTAIVVKIYPKSALAVDTLLFKENKANFSLNVDTPSFYSMVLSNKKAFTLFLQKGDKIKVTKQENGEDSFKIEGSEISERIEKLFTYQSKYQKQIQKLSQQSQGASKERMDSIIRFAESLDISFKTKIADYIKEKPGSPEALLAVYQGVGKRMVFDLFSDYSIFKMVYDSLSQSSLNVDDHLKFLKENMDRTQAADFVLPDTEGNNVNFADYKGKWTILDFWASWCKPCRDINPELVKIHNDYKELQMVSVSLDGLPKQENPKKEWLDAIKKDKLTWTNLSDLKGGQTEVVRLYQFSSIPQTLLINPEGRIVGKNMPIAKVRETLNKAFNK